MEQAATAKDPTKMERDILGHLIKSPYFAMELAEEGGQQKLAGYATAIADAFREARGQDNTQAGAASSGTVTSPIAISNQDDYNALPSGSVYIDPGDNKTYRKP